MNNEFSDVAYSIDRQVYESKMKEVYSGNIKIFWSGVERHFKDAEGNEQEVSLDTMRSTVAADRATEKAGKKAEDMA